MYYIIFINNIKFGEILCKAQEIMEYLLEKKIWAFSSNAANQKYLDKDDRAVVYLAGKGNRYFAADFTIASKSYEVKLDSNEQDWLAMFPIRIEIDNINIWAERLPIEDVIAQLNFIKDKKNYGLYFRQATKVIDEKDFSLIRSKK